jgi:hypothetical protein
MISLTYLSTARVPFGDSELAELLEASRARNHAAGLTGMLLYAGGHFIQTLEGADEAVDTVFARIERDQRHRSIIIALREEIDARVFPDWSMGFENVDDGDAQDLPGFNTYLSDGAISAKDGERLGRPGIFHRVFRDNMR